MSRDDVREPEEVRSSIEPHALNIKRLWRITKQSLGDYKWEMIGVFWVMAIALGYIGFSNYSSATGQAHTLWDSLYRTLQLFGLRAGDVSGPVNWQLQVARFLAPAVAIWTALVALAVILRDQLLLLRLRRMRNHTVICGLGRKGLLLAESFLENGEQVVVIERDGNNDLIGRCRDSGAIVLFGNATNPRILRRARVNVAKHLISVCGEDGINAEVAVHAREIVRNCKGRSLSCVVHVVDPQLCQLLREYEMGIGKLDTFALDFFNVFDSGARVMLNQCPPFDKTDEEKAFKTHIVVIGVGRMGQSLVVNAARKWRDRGSENHKRLCVTLIDREAEKRMESLYLGHHGLDMLCELVPHSIDVRSPEFERAAFLFDNQEQYDLKAIYVCLDDDSLALATALKLDRQTITRNLRVPIVVRMTHDSGLATLLRVGERERDNFCGVQAFGLLDHACTPDLTHNCTYEVIARAFHEDYVQAELAKGVTPDGNPSLLPWEDLPEDLKDSNRSEAKHILAKLKAIGCDIAMTGALDSPLFEFAPEEIELMAKIEHERFVKERLGKGWRYGHTKDLAKKMSPSLVPWEQLSEEDKEKDRVSVRNIPKLLSMVGFQIYRFRNVS
jgi:hypothetical protein